ncbi:hypothetical protein AMAG_08932 [Allomyces macrogynus ATCC 38327]|uniref:Glutamate decarboxylase n=1 Tax=Allomyces macrogynus (strain ATCC 38327) TaxID=578462 RepID=A0A0L0SN03_ALLM3|nr:hypothetical protein, variant [Allomyces macrogynus ATCC 38327]KNE63868.1 hypothetical protein AMAG_08932 [Allomyces macrogynus ATCC 38327]|eukprot:KNE63867.1 hypothetical protein, variant [Allomyces macrogynus ATCC 38327]
MAPPPPYLSTPSATAPVASTRATATTTTMPNGKAAMANGTTLKAEPAIDAAHAANDHARTDENTADGAAPRSAQAQELGTLLSALTHMLLQHVDENHDPATRVLHYVPPRDLAARLHLTFPDAGCDLPSLLAAFQSTLDYSVRTGHPLFMDKLYTGPTPVAIAAELLSVALNINTHVFSVSPVGTLMEMACLRELRRLIGYPTNGSGLTLPGGSMSNLVAMCTARNVMFPSIKTDGLHSLPPLAVFTSVQSHYSVEKSAMILGIGRKYVFAVECTPDGRMLASDLDTQILNAKAQGCLPFFVNATAGTTVLCAYDPVREIAAVTKRHQLWLHVDGSWGGTVMFSDKLRHKLDGVELSDSYVVNPHKMLGVPLQCSCLLVAHPPTTMARANSSKANYLYHAPSPAPGANFADPDSDEEEEPLYDLGNLGLGCGRRADGVKLFLSWKWAGTAGYASRVEAAFARADALRAKVAAHPKLARVMESGETGANVCFWYVPADARADVKGWRERLVKDPREFARVADLTARMRVEMVQRGKILVDYAPLPGPNAVPNFWRVPMNSPAVTDKHLDAIVDEIVAIGDLVSEQDASA